MGNLGIVLSVVSFFSFACLFSGGTYSEEAQDAFDTWFISYKLEKDQEFMNLPNNY